MNIIDVCNGCASFNLISNEPICRFYFLIINSRAISNHVLQSICPCATCIVKLQCDQFCDEFEDAADKYGGRDVLGD